MIAVDVALLQLDGGEGLLQRQFVIGGDLFADQSKGVTVSNGGVVVVLVDVLVVVVLVVVDIVKSLKFVHAPTDIILTNTAPSGIVYVTPEGAVRRDLSTPVASNTRLGAR